MLSDRDIETKRRYLGLGIEPFQAANLQPASYDLTLDRHYLVPDPDITEVDLADVQAGHMLPYTASPEEPIVLSQHDFILASTRETVTIPADLLGRVEGKSSLGRLGLIVHITAGFIDPGFHGQITLEIVNLAPWGLVLYPGQRIAQIAFSEMSQMPRKPYGSAGNHYQGQQGPVESRFRLGESFIGVPPTP